MPLAGGDITVYAESATKSLLCFGDTARYIPPLRPRDWTPRRWRDRFPIWWLAFAVIVMLIVFLLICRAQMIGVRLGVG